MSWKLFNQIVLLMLIGAIILTGMKVVKKSLYRHCKDKQAMMYPSKVQK